MASACLDRNVLKAQLPGVWQIPETSSAPATEWVFQQKATFRI
jgi:hypothetical protein